MRYYRDMVNKHVIPIVGDKKLSELNQPMIEAAKDKLLKTRSRAMTQKTISPAESWARPLSREMILQCGG